MKKTTTSTRSFSGSARNRLNRNAHIRSEHLKKMLPEKYWDMLEVLQMQKWQSNAHNFDVIVPTEKYFKSNPEYYALYRGKRLPRIPIKTIPGKGVIFV